MHDSRFEELAALAAIGALDSAERTDLDRHLARGCPVCRRDLESLRVVAGELAFSVPAAEPPARLRKRLPSGTRQQGSRAARMALAAAVLLAVTAGDDLRLRMQARTAEASFATTRAELARRDLRAKFLEDPEVQALALKGLAVQPRSSGKIYFSPRARRAILLALNMAALPSNRQYELWMIVGGTPIPAGSFDAASASTVFESALLPDHSGGERFAVTIEPRGGVPLPTGPMVLLGPA